MKTEIIEQEQKTEWNFPCLGKHNITELVILFTSERKGTVLVSDISFVVGCYSNEWPIDEFTPITEPTTIKFIP